MRMGKPDSGGLPCFEEQPQAGYCGELTGFEERVSPKSRFLSSASAADAKRSKVSAAPSAGRASLDLRAEYPFARIRYLRARFSYFRGCFICQPPTHETPHPPEGFLANPRSEA